MLRKPTGCLCRAHQIAVVVVAAAVDASQVVMVMLSMAQPPMVAAVVEMISMNWIKTTSLRGLDRTAAVEGQEAGCVGKPKQRARSWHRQQS